MERKLVRLNAVVGFYPAASVGDDIEVYAPDSDADAMRAGPALKVFHGLRQQVRGSGGAGGGGGGGAGTQGGAGGGLGGTARQCALPRASRGTRPRFACAPLPRPSTENAHLARTLRCLSRVTTV